MSDLSDLDNLLDASLDDLADLPEFGTYPGGTHKVAIDWESKKVNDHPSLELKFKLVETLELANPTDEPLAVGAEGSVLFMLDNEFGQGKLKNVLKPLGAATGANKMSEIVAASKGMEVVLVTKVRQNKDKTQSYTDIVKVIV
jgi:hypothetical protein